MAPPAADEEGMGPLERGRRRYQQKDYSGSLSAFTEAVNMSSGYMKLTALDHRAAAQEKLEQFQPALSDAKKMIDLKPELSKGYLRCGKVLQLKGNPQLALKIYERGLGKVKVGTDEERTMLQKMYNKAKRALAPKKVLDPLVFLPLELAEMVCRYLTMRDRVICLAVSKPWKRLLESSHKLWTTLDTTYAKKSMNHKSLKAHLKRSNYTLDHAIITLRAGLDLQKMTYITSSCKNLRRLEIRGSGVIGESLTKSVPYSHSLNAVSVSGSCAITSSAVHETLASLRRTITEAYFLCVKGSLHPNPPRDLPQLDCLKILHFKAAGTGTGLDTNRLMQATPNLEAVALNHWVLGPNFDVSLWPRLQHLDLTDTQITLLPALPSTLKHLILNNNRHLRVDIGDHQFPSPPLLETFACTGTTLNNSVIKDITRESSKRGNLKTLLIGDRVADWRGRVEDDYPASETVEELSLASLWEQEHKLIQIVNLYPNVRKLDISSTKATGVAVKYFVQMGVQYLKLNECSEVGIDAVEWARGQGVAVEFNFPSRSGNARGYRDSALATGY
ncbi:F-box/TPR repeat protein pof3 [Lachnellula cervina]|uniref:F-box/TPR repeat protein pof3 n=1 Tax=Lachnellula cervina TaxID=1316786 RepID=A0A7D8Z0P6_9HELO|nr:F-box/TPR repeat protein pof3 [Lachnellula cervina]